MYYIEKLEIDTSEDVYSFTNEIRECSQPSRNNSSPPEPGDLSKDALSPYQKQLGKNTVYPLFTSSKESPLIDYDISFLIEQIDKDLIVSFIENITSFGPRVTGTSACEEAGRWIYHQFKDMGLEVRYHNWSSTSTLFGSNIEATLPGADPTSDDIYIVCGHYDSVPGSPGADDNGAGTAAVLASAYVMQHYSFNHTIRFVAFSGEEQGLHGSYHYAKEAYENNEPIKAVLNADMMGYAQNQESEGKVIVYDNDPSSWVTDVSVDVSSRYVDLINLEIVHGGYSGRSDHASFYAFEYDAIFYFEYEVNPFYHTSNDTLENMNPWYASNVSKLILATLSELSSFVPQLPPNTPQRPSGRTNGISKREYTYETKTIDPNADEVYYKWSWGDGTTSEWLGPFPSNTIHTVNYAWDDKGTYEVRVKAKDIFHAESDWSESLAVNMPRIQFSLLPFYLFERFNIISYF